MAAAADPSEVLPLSPAAFRVLLALAEEPRHGYSIIKEIESSTSGAVKIRFATLYGLLKQMLTDGWIVEVQRDAEGDPRRRYYRLTPWGRRIAAAEAERLADLVRTARARHLLTAIEPA